MSENENVTATEEAVETNDTKVNEPATEAVAETTPEVPEAPAEPEVEHEISYHAVEKEGTVTAIWEMQGPKHLRTIDPRSNEGKKILSLFETAV